MEAKDIADITYQLIRLKEDRSSMEYEDIFSRQNRELIQMKEKYEKLKVILQKQKLEYEGLYQKVLDYSSGKKKHKNKTLTQTIKDTQPIQLDSKKRLLESENLSDQILENKNKKKYVPINVNVPEEDRHVVNLTNQNDSFEGEYKGPFCKNTSTNNKKVELLSEIYPFQNSKSSSSILNHVPNKVMNNVNDQAKDQVDLPQQPRLFPYHRNNQDLASKKPLTDAGDKLPCKLPYQPKYVEVVRNRAEREALPGHTCEECEKFYNAMIAQGVITKDQKKDFLRDCSRHKSRYSPPSTPDNFWDISIRTPDDWR